MSTPVSAAEPTEIDRLPPASGAAIQRRLQRAAVLVTQAEAYAEQTLPLLRSATRHLAGTMERLDALIERAEMRTGDTSEPAAMDEQLTAAVRIERIDKIV